MSLQSYNFFLTNANIFYKKCTFLIKYVHFLQISLKMHAILSGDGIDGRLVGFARR